MLRGTHSTRTPAYWRCSIRVSALIVQHLHWIASREGWQTSDLARALVCLGASGSFLRLGDPDAADRFKTLATVRPLLAALDVALGGTSRRPYAARRPSVSDLLALRLPRGLSEIITAYATKSGRSRNGVLEMFLERGLIIYLKGQNILLETIRSLNPERTSKGIRDKTKAGDPAQQPKAGVDNGKG